MKKLFLFIVAIFAVSTLWAAGFYSGDLYYNITSSSEPYTAEVTSAYNYVGFTIVTIPSTVTYNGITYSVTSIDGHAFSSCSKLTSVTIPESVKSIGSGAFSSCSALTSINIPEGVTNIESYTFEDCSSLTSITIPNSVTRIEYRAFNGTGIYNDESNWENDVLYIDNCLIGAKISKSGAYTIKENTRLIAGGTFKDCSSLTSITIPNSVTSIGEYAFSGCSSLTSITIPNSVTSIGSGAFSSCSALTSINIPEGVTNIESYTFENCSSLTSITIPNSVTSIGYGAFQYCSSLTSAIMGNNVTSFGDLVFQDCKSLISIVLPNTVQTIGGGLFCGCEALTSVVLPENLDSLLTERHYHLGFFENCHSLSSITLPEYLIAIGDDAFYNCSSLTSIAIPNSVTSIGDGAFQWCSSLTSVTIPNSVMSIGCYAFDRTPWYANLSDGVIYIGQVLYTYKGNMPANTSIDVKEGTTAISPQAFSTRSSLVAITLPESLITIGNRAFSNCSSLTAITLPESLITIEDYAFSDCSLLTAITLPKGLNSVGYYAFKSCLSLTSVTWNVKNHVDGYFSYNTPFCDISSQITSFILGDSVQTIPACLCYKMDKLTSVTIPNSVTSIGGYAFSGCTSLTSIAIPCNVTSIAQTSFDDCTSLSSVVWNAKTSIDYYKSPFDSSKSTLKSITFGDSVKYIPEYICANLDSLKYVTIGNSVTSIGNRAFSGCLSLTKTNCTGDVASWCNIKFGNSEANPMVYSRNFYINDVEIKDLIIPNSVDSIHKYAFSDCSSLTSITIGNSVRNIERSAFSNCSSLTSVTIPNSVTNIGYSAFSGCSSLRSAIIGNGISKIENNTFENCSTLSYFAIGSRVENVGNRAFSACPIDTLFLRNPIPPTFESIGMAKNSISRIYVPCGSYSAYKNSSWNNYAKYSSSFEDDNVFFLNTNVTDSVAGRVETVSEANCDKGYTIKAIPTVGYEFVQWSDGVTDALRTLDLTQDTTLIAEFRQLFDGKCGDNLYWKHYDDKIIIHGEGAMYDYAADSVPWYQFRDIVKTVEVFDGATSIGNNAFTLCKNLNTLTLSGTIENIGENAFGGCRMLFDIYCYILFPPIASENSFINYNAYLYILCDYQRYYAADMVFGNFRNMQCIGTQSTPTDGMVITPSFNDVTITWPTVANAGSYTLTINKDGEAFCTLIFNAAGQLTGIAFAPSRNGQRHAPAATQTANGFTFTVTGLEEGTDYSYNLVIKDNSGKTLQTYSGEFRTQSTNDRTVTVEYDAIQGQVTGAGIYLVGDTVTLTAIPNDGYRFVRWSNEVEDNPYTFVISENMTLSAEFESVIPSSVENTHTQSPMTNCQKIIHDNQLLILRDGKTYNVMGVIVE